MDCVPFKMMPKCRACLKSAKNMIPLDDKYIMYFNILTNLNLKLATDDPEVLCKQCRKALQSFMNFREQCITANTVFAVVVPNESFKEEGELDNEVKMKQELADHDYEDNNELIFEDNLTYMLVVKSEGGDIESTDPINYDCVEECKNVLSDKNGIKKDNSKPSRKKKCVKTIRKPKKCVKTTKINLTSAAKIIDEKRFPKPSDNSLLCGLCTSTFENNDKLQSHLSEHRQSQTCQVCNEKFIDWQEIISHRMDHLPLGKVQCHLCPQNYKSALRMELHLRLNHSSGEDRRTLRCRICNRTFGTSMKLRVHYLNIHNTGNKKFYCDYCNKMFLRKHGLKIHIASHLDAKPYVCNLCNKAFKFSQKLAIHKIEHIPERVYCKLCKRPFVSQSELDKHSCKKYSAVLCPVCGKICKNTGDARRHFLRVHDKNHFYKCDRCPKTYKIRQSLVAHQNKHDGIRKYACEFCPAKFYERSTLTKHRRTHTGVKPYVCELQLAVNDPQQLCKLCFTTLQQFIEFRTKCIAANLVFSSIILKQDIKKEDDIDSDIAFEVKQEVLEIDITKMNDEPLEDDAHDHYDVEYDLVLKTNEVDNNQDNINVKKSVQKNISKLTKKKSLKPRAKGDKSKRKDIKTEKSERKNVIYNMNSSGTLLCGLCTKSFEDDNQLHTHIPTHGVYNSCSLCSEKFADWQELMAHRLEHLPERRLQCHLCTMKFKSSLYIEHHYRKVHHSEGERQTLRCRTCNKNYSTPRRLRSHNIVTHNTKNKTFYCDYCNKLYFNKSTLKIHIRTHVDTKPYRCDVCDFSCKIGNTLRLHKISKHNKERRHCTRCKKVFVTSSELGEHVCTQSDSICPTCGKMFSCTTKMNRHILTHDKDHWYKCDRCPAAYKAKSSLVVHKNKHNGERRHACEYCPAKFYFASVLIKHRRTHTGIKPYVCKVCQKAFTGNNNLKVHMKVHGKFLINKKEPEDDELSLKQDLM
ncbi:zinc finger protein 585A [Bicyclus anynana]|uniref:Zinc finger protein 585A n=1 Tax=Bicyclus anynana TaxID=110368 RepID=A0ABM3LJY3_BICAN|nr:zinc finger protein 585A [Bicyclus anynana]